MLSVQCEYLPLRPGHQFHEFDLHCVGAVQAFHLATGIAGLATVEVVGDQGAHL